MVDPEIKKIARELMSHMPSSEFTTMQQHEDTQKAYGYHGSLTLKNQGNQLHGTGKYSDAIKKYYQAKQNLLTLRTPEALALRKACSLNLMSCYLKMGEFRKTIAEGIEVLESDSNNLKALYRRGLAYQKLGKLGLAFTDLSKAAKLAPDDETVVNAWRQLQDQLEIQGEVVCSPPKKNELITENIIKSEAQPFSASTLPSQEIDQNSSQPSGSKQQTTKLPNQTEISQILKQYPEMLRSMQSAVIMNPGPEHVAPISQMTPKIVKLDSGMANKLSPGDNDMKKIFDMISSFRNQSMDSTSGNASSLSTPLTQDLSSSEMGDNEDSTSELVTGSDILKISPEMQEQMKLDIKNPSMKQTMSSMVLNMTPENMVAVSEQIGIKPSREDAEKVKSAVDNITPDDLERMMKWANKAQAVVETARKGKNYLLGYPGLILATVMLIIAVLLKW